LRAAAGALLLPRVCQEPGRRLCGKARASAGARARPRGKQEELTELVAAGATQASDDEVEVASAQVVGAT
jgi:hypothetical protein